MNNVTQSLYQQKVQSTAQELIDNGYEVSIEPSSSDLPFELGGYRVNQKFICTMEYAREVVK